MRTTWDHGRAQGQGLLYRPRRNTIPPTQYDPTPRMFPLRRHAEGAVRRAGAHLGHGRACRLQDGRQVPQRLPRLRLDAACHEVARAGIDAQHPAHKHHTWARAVDGRCHRLLSRRGRNMRPPSGRGNCLSFTHHPPPARTACEYGPIAAGACSPSPRTTVKPGAPRRPRRRPNAAGCAEPCRWTRWCGSCPAPAMWRGRAAHFLDHYPRLMRSPSRPSQFAG